jgi:hypothetical protein
MFVERLVVNYVIYINYRELLILIFKL